MINDDERREAAAKLRALDIHYWYDFADEIDSLESAIECNVGQRFESQSWWHRLADLVDRPTCRNVADTSDGGLFECSNCGETWELTCGGPEENHLLFCPNCGCEIAGGDDGGDDDDDR